MILLVLMIGLMNQLCAQDYSNVDLVGRNVLSPIVRMQDVVVEGHYAYVADEVSGLVIVDIQDPENLEVVGICNTPNEAKSVDVSGDYAYVCDLEDGLRIIDIGDPANPEEVGYYDVEGDSYDAAMYGNYVLFGGYETGVYVVDVSIPANPLQVAFADMYHVIGIVVSGDYAYAISSSHQMSIIDLSDITNPESISSLQITGGIHSITVQGDIAVAGVTQGYYVVDIGDPVNPNIETYISCDNYDLKLDNNYLYCARGMEGITVFDMSDPVNPSIVNEIPINIRPQVLTISDGYVFAGLKGLFAIDISDPTQPELLGEIPSLGFVWDVEVSGAYAYVGSNDYFHALDISDPHNPVLIYSYEIEDTAFSIEVSDGLAIAGTISGDSWLFDVSDPTAIQPLAVIEFERSVYGVAFSGNYVFSIGDHRMSVADISDPTNPSIEVEMESLIGRKICISGNYAYIASHNGITIVAIEDPLDPIVLSFTELGYHSFDVAVTGNTAVIADTEYGLITVDVSNPENPVLLAMVPTPDTAVDVTTDGDFAYVSDYGAGLRVFDIRDPSYPVETGYYNDLGVAYNVALDDRYVYVAEGNGLGIYDCSTAGVEDPITDTPDAPIRYLGNSPNPFNPNTTIRYSLAAPGKVSLCIYNVRGEKVKTLYDGVQDVGEHSHVWNGLDDSGKAVASGVYLNRLESTDQTVTGKMLLLK